MVRGKCVMMAILQCVFQPAHKVGTEEMSYIITRNPVLL